MLIDLTGCLIAPQGAQLPAVADSSHSQKLESGSHVGLDWRYASYLHLQSSGLFLSRCRSVKEEETCALRETSFTKVFDNCLLLLLWPRQTKVRRSCCCWFSFVGLFICVTSCVTVDSSDGMNSSSVTEEISNSHEDHDQQANRKPQSCLLPHLHSSAPAPGKILWFSC